MPRRCDAHRRLAGRLPAAGEDGQAVEFDGAVRRLLVSVVHLSVHGVVPGRESGGIELHLLSGQLRPGDDNGSLVARLAELQERVALVAGRVQKVRAQIRAVHDGLLDEGQAATALALFDPVWQGLAPEEQARVLGLLVQRVDYDGARGKVSITFHPAGIQALADELAGREEERSA